MKKLIAMAAAILLTAGIAVFANGTTPGGEPNKQFNYQVSFSRIVITNDINVILKESNDKTIDINGNDAAIENVDWKIKDDVLYLKSKNGKSMDKASVTINVAQLKELFIKGKSTVTSLGHLNSPNLYVHLENDCHVALKNIGQIYVVNGYGTELDVKRIVGNVRVGG